MAETKTENKEVQEEQKEALSPSEYFEMIKSMKEHTTTTDLVDFYNTAVTKIKKYMITGQKEAAKHLYNLCELAKREMDIIEAGFDTFVYREDIDTYVDKVTDECVVCVELQDYERDIPDEIVDKIVTCKEKNLFDKYYIFFTDYTGEKRSKVEEKKRAKDPILFGNCMIEGKISNRLFFIGDWVDEYCDLTLDKMISAMAREYTDGASMKRSATPILTLEEADKLIKGETTDVFVGNKRAKKAEASPKKVEKAKKPRKKKTDEK